MDAKVLAHLVANVIKTGDRKELTEEETYRFYREFEVEVADTVEQMRSDKRRAYEELKNIAIR